MAIPPDRPHPGVPFPPPFIPASVFLIGLAIERWGVRLRWSEWIGARVPLVVMGWLLILVGLGIGAWAITTFVRARTTVLPNQPSNALVTSGPYQFSRNPMYVGLTTLYVGLALVFDLVWPVLLLPLAIAGLRYLVIRREEYALERAFGEEYIRFKVRVRRWL
jgi:protein-S-isoprenylcysteine O-methyltransferase Ste14